MTNVLNNLRSVRAWLLTQPTAGTALALLEAAITELDADAKLQLDKATAELDSLVKERDLELKRKTKEKK